MKAVIQRVTESAVSIGGIEKSRIGRGFLILLGIETRDAREDALWLARKISQLRIFEDEDGKMNRSLIDIGGDSLVVSQFTLLARVKKGTRPSFDRAAKPEQAIPLYEAFVSALETETGSTPGTGEFGAMMQVSLVNDGPVTILIDTRNRE